MSNDGANTTIRALLAHLPSVPTFLGALLLAGGLYTLLTLPPPPTVVPAELPEAPTEPTSEVRQEVSLLIAEADGTRTVRREVALPEPPEARLTVVLAALRQVMLEDDGWPDALRAPQVFIVELLSRERVAVLDFPLTEAPANVTVAQEARLIDSVVATVRRNSNLDRVHFLVNGQKSSTLLGFIALEQGLE